MIRRPPRSTRTMNRRQRQMCIRDSNYTDVTKGLDRTQEKYKRIDKLDIIDIYLDERSVKEISKEYGIKPENISNIKNKKTYRNITKELDLY